MTSKKTLTLADVNREEHGPIWVVNRADSASEGRPADVQMTVRTKDGSTIPVLVEYSSLAVDLTTQAPRDSLLNSQAFLRAVNNGLLELVSEAEAERINTTRLAVSERERLFQRKAALQAAARNPLGDRDEPQAKFEVTRRTTATVQAQGTQVSLSGLASTPEEASNAFKQWVSLLNTQDEATAIKSLLEKQQLARVEAIYLRDNTQHTRIREYLVSTT